MCKNCLKYKDLGCQYCLDCGVLLNESTEKTASESDGMFKHAMELDDVNLENFKNNDDDKNRSRKEK